MSVATFSGNISRPTYEVFQDMAIRLLMVSLCKTEEEQMEALLNLFKHHPELKNHIDTLDTLAPYPEILQTVLDYEEL